MFLPLEKPKETDKLVSLFSPGGTVLEDVVDCLFCFFAIAEWRVYYANLLQVHLQATVSCSQPEYAGLLPHSLTWRLVMAGNCQKSMYIVSEF